MGRRDPHGVRLHIVHFLIALRGDTLMADVKKNVEQQLQKEFSKKPFARKERNLLYRFTRLSHDVELTKHYKGQLPIPRIPYFHPYNPNTNPTQAGGIPGSIVTVCFPKEINKQMPVPEPILKILTELKADPAKIDLFFVTQNMPWKTEGTPLLVRPHYWVHGQADIDKAIEAGTYNANTPCRVGIFSAKEEGITCDKTKGVLGSPIAVSSHPGEAKLNEGIICSPNGVGVIQGLDFTASHSLFSVVATPDGRVAVTLHWMLNPTDQESVINISKRVQNLNEFMQEVFKLKNSQLNSEKGPLSDLMQMLGTTKPELEKDIKQKMEKDASMGDDWELALALAESTLVTTNKKAKPELKQDIDSYLKQMEEFHFLLRGMNEEVNSLAETFSALLDDVKMTRSLEHTESTLRIMTELKNHISGTRKTLAEKGEATDINALSLLSEVSQKLGEEAARQIDTLSNFISTEQDYIRKRFEHMDAGQKKDTGQKNT